MKVTWAVSTVGKHLFVDQPCLTQALVVQLLFKRRKIPADLHIGVAKDSNGQLEAHAWVESDGVVVIGGSETDLQHYARLPSLDGIS